MYLTSHQLSFFKTFGFLKISQLFKDEIKPIETEFENLMQEHFQKHELDLSKRNLRWQLIDSSEKLSKLIDDPRIEGLLSDILGDDFIYTGSSGNYYSGNSGWHCDEYYDHLRVKIVFYLDELTASTGALRVIPFSQNSTGFDLELLKKIGKSKHTWGIMGSDIPSYPIEVCPGDIIVFNQNIFHSSWGGGQNRRMFSINAHKRYDEESVYKLKNHINILSRFLYPNVFGNYMVDYANKQRMKHLDQVLENSTELPKLVEIAKQNYSEPSRDIQPDFNDDFYTEADFDEFYQDPGYK